MQEPEITLKQVTELYVRLSWFAGYLEGNTVQNLAAKYYVWKAQKHHTRYLESREIGKFINGK